LGQLFGRKILSADPNFMLGSKILNIIKFLLNMAHNPIYRIQKKRVFSPWLEVKRSQTTLGFLYLPFFTHSGTYFGKKIYEFRCVNSWGNSFRIFKNGKSIGYIQMHVFRNLAQINLLEDGPFFFSTKGLSGMEWVVRKGMQSLEMVENKINLHQIDEGIEETILACGLFLGERVKKDFQLFVPIILIFWIVLIYLL
jgi:hypothetical protein